MKTENARSRFIVEDRSRTSREKIIQSLPTVSHALSDYANLFLVLQYFIGFFFTPLNLMKYFVSRCFDRYGNWTPQGWKIKSLIYIIVFRCFKGKQKLLYL